MQKQILLQINARLNGSYVIGLYIKYMNTFAKDAEYKQK